MFIGAVESATRVEGGPDDILFLLLLLLLRFLFLLQMALNRVGSEGGCVMGRGRGGRGRAIISVDDIVVAGVSIAENEAITIGHQKAGETDESKNQHERDSGKKQNEAEGQN